MQRQSILRSLSWQVGMVIAAILLCHVVFAVPNSNSKWHGPVTGNLNLPDGTYVGHSKANDDLISYRLVLTVEKQRVASADFRELYDGFDWGSGSAPYVEMWIIDPPRRATFLANVPEYEAQAAAAISYNSALVGLRNPNQLPPPPSNATSVYEGLVDSWNSLLQLKLQLVMHVNVTTLGDNDGTLHTWYEYIPECVRDKPWRKIPLVLSLHGSGNTIVQAEGLGFPFIGAQECFITIIPDDSAQPSGNGNWNVAPSANSTALSDVEFLLALIRHEEATKAIDSTRIFMTGISNGAAMSTYLSMLYPELFAGIAAITGAVGCTGGAYNADFIATADAVLAKGAPLLPAITGAGNEDQYTWVTPLRNTSAYSTAAPCYQNQVSYWKRYNGIAQIVWNPNYPWGQPLEDMDSYEAYGFKIDTGTLSPPPGPPRKPALLSFYTVEDMYHLDPNPSVDVISWAFLKHFSRQPNGKLLFDGCDID